MKFFRVIEMRNRLGEDCFVVCMDEPTYRNCIRAYGQYTAPILKSMGMCHLLAQRLKQWVSL